MISSTPFAPSHPGDAKEKSGQFTSASTKATGVILSHAFGNQNVRQALLVLSQTERLDRYQTGLFWDSRWKINRWLPRRVTTELNRRSYPQIPSRHIFSTPLREAGRLLALRFGLSAMTEWDRPLSERTIRASVDRATARAIRRWRPGAVYAYEGGAQQTFQAGRREGTLCIYELPSGYWRFELDLMREEAVLRPEYADTMLRLKLSGEALDIHDEELKLADFVIVPSQHVCRTLQGAPVLAEKVRVIPYGADESDGPRRPLGHSGRKLRVLFVGGLTQRKGIGYLIDAVRMMGSALEFTIVGTKIGHCEPIEAATRSYRWISGAPHREILAEMARHDVLALPSLSDGFGLVIPEALSRGLPVVTTINSGGPEIVRDGRDGFFVPIRSAEAIAEKLELLNKDRDLLDYMSSSARKRAREISWIRYRDILRITINDMLA